MLSTFSRLTFAPESAPDAITETKPWPVMITRVVASVTDSCVPSASVVNGAQVVPSFEKSKSSVCDKVPVTAKKFAPRDTGPMIVLPDAEISMLYLRT